ncbi:MAG: hypothetical protein NBV67_05805 [Tagaea sp.]|nr:hypothetical protein [Tagaea sp.]
MRALLAVLLSLAAFPALAQDATRIGALVEVRGAIAGDATLAGAAIAVEADIAGDLVGAGFQIGVGGATTVARNVFLIGHTLAIGGEFAQRAWLSGIDVTADPQVRGDLKIASAGPVRIGPNARVGGTLTVWSPGPPEIHASAQIAGGVIHNPGGFESSLEALIGKVAWLIYWIFWAFVLLTGLALAVFAPGFTNASAESIRTKTLDVAAWGAALMFGAPLAALLAAFTLVGLPLAATLILLLVLFAALGYLIAAAALGGAALRLAGVEPARAIFWGMMAMAIGLAGLFASGHIPVLGDAIGFAAYLLGLGAFARETFRRMR